MKRSSVYEPQDRLDTAAIARGRGYDVLHDPVYNKGTGHSLEERERLGLRGLLPIGVSTMDQQVKRSMERYWHGDDYLTVEEETLGGITHEHLRKWHVLDEVHQRNETLYYKMLAENFTEMAPIVYTPVVGYVCSYFHKLFRRPRGMTFTAADRGEMATFVWNWPSEEVDAIVVTDGSRILGLGDLGANGLGIPIGKLDLYVTAGGFNPGRVLPCVVDVGTNNTELLNDPWYIGLKQPRLIGEDYLQVLDEFVSAVMGRWPNAVLQFEDFSIEHAELLLERYRHCHCVFNDDIQGTAACAVAGLMGAMAVLGKKPEALTEQRFVCVGAGSAGMGVTRMIHSALVNYGLSPEEAAGRFHIIDQYGLITSSRSNLPSHIMPFARTDSGSVDGETLVSVLRRTKPSVLIGLSGAGRLFTKEALEIMAENNERPIIFPMSNPTSKMECTLAEAMEATKSRAIFACGSPQEDIESLGPNGSIRCSASQANNMYIFPGLAMAAFLAQGNIVTDLMLMAAAEALPALLTKEELTNSRVFPSMENIRSISTHIACAVIKAAAKEGHVNNTFLIRAMAKGNYELRRYVKSHMYKPEYRSLVAPNGGARMHAPYHM
jgi:malate dehydrogenase (decarboxylating)